VICVSLYALQHPVGFGSIREEGLKCLVYLFNSNVIFSSHKYLNKIEGLINYLMKLGKDVRYGMIKVIYWV